MSHAKFSASGSSRWLNCAGSIRLESEAPPEEENKYALEGTEAHELFALWLSNLKKGKIFKGQKNYDSEMVQAVSKAIKHVQKTVSDINYIEVEQKVSLEFIHDDMWGTADLIDPEPYGTLGVDDYKHGKGHVVNVETEKGLNTQLVFYALGAAHKYHYNFSLVRLGIIQPRAKHRDGFYRSVTISIKELKKYIDLFKRGVDRASKPNAKLFVGSWCWFCKARTICPLYNKNNLDEARKDLE